MTSEKFRLIPQNAFKVELKLKWTKHFVLSAAGNDNGNNDNNIIFLIQRLKICVRVVTLSTGDNQKLQN